MQIRSFAYELECVVFYSCNLHDIKIITTKFHNSTPKCSPKTEAPLLYISGPVKYLYSHAYSGQACVSK